MFSQVNHVKSVSLDSISATRSSYTEILGKQQQVNLDEIFDELEYKLSNNIGVEICHICPPESESKHLANKVDNLSARVDLLQLERYHTFYAWESF